jgi:spore coat polysaccharide biosynthesis protein SpsF
MTRVFIQARMSSRRFPGKVLTPLSGRPVLQRLVDAVTEVVPRTDVAILTSTDPSDEAIAAFAGSLDVAVVRGPLDDVFGRFRVALAQLACDRFVRLSADSPVLPPVLLERMLGVTADGADLVTNVFPRTFPRGWSVEVVNAATFAATDPGLLTAHDREHVTPYFYASPGRFTIRNVASANPDDASLSLAVDSPEDLARIERMVDRGELPPVTFA